MAWVDQLGGQYTMLMYAYGIFAVTWPLFLIMEKLWPVHEATPGKTYVFNWQIVAINFVLTPLASGLVVLGTLSLSQYFGLPGFDYPILELGLGIPFVDAALQIVVLILVSCLLTDFWYYWWHRFQHVFPWLWELHKLHHSEEHMNSTTIYRSHFLELAGQALVRGLSVGLVFDLNGMPETLLVVLAAGLFPPIWDFFIHANVRMDRISKLLPWFSTPQYHWIHHSALPRHQDKNFAIWLPLFDIIFGSYYKPELDEYPPTGLSSGEKIDTLWEAQAGPFKAWLSGSYRQTLEKPEAQER
ncbi:MAG: sterol desaturase family protein [Pseudomonadales bacterium]